MAAEPGRLGRAAPTALLLALAGRCLAAPRLAVLAAGGIGLLLAAGLFRLEVRTDGEILEPPDHPTMLADRRDRAVFGDSDRVVVLVTAPPEAPPLTSPASLAGLAELHQALGRLPAVRSSGVRSIVNLRNLEVSPESLLPWTLLDPPPGSPEELAERLRRLWDNPLAETLLSHDGKAAAFVVPKTADAGRRELLAQVEGLTDRWGASSPHRLWVTGPLVAEARLGDAVLEDLARLVPLMMVVILAVLALTLKSAGGVLVPMLEVGLVLVATFGFLGWAGLPLTLVTTPLPVVLMALAITDEVHLVGDFQRRLAAVPVSGQAPDRPAVRRLLEQTLATLAGPLVATSVTTAAGLLAFTAAPIPPLRHFGLAGAVGILLAMLLSFTVIPAVMVLLPGRWFLPRGGRRLGAEEAGLPIFERWALRLGGWGLPAAGLLVALALPGITRLTIEDNWVANFPPDSPIVTADRIFNRAFWGSHRIDVVLEGPEESFFTPEGARRVEQVVRLARARPEVAGVLSVLTPLEVIRRAHGEPRPASELAPERLEDFLTLASLSEDPESLGGLITSDGSRARVELFVESEDYGRDRSLVRDLETHLAAGAAGGAFHLSGDIPVGLATVAAVVHGQLASIALAYLLIAGLAFAVYPRGRAALVVLVPVTAATAVVFGLMGYLSIPLGIATSMFAGLAVGVGVDFGFYLQAAAGRRADRATGPAASPRAAAVRAFAAAGRPVRSNAAVLALGFSVLWLSAVRPNHDLGLLLAAALTATYGFVLLAAPPLLELEARSGATAPPRLAGGAAREGVGG